jgi:hypothetical protein
MFTRNVSMDLEPNTFRETRIEEGRICGDKEKNSE